MNILGDTDTAVRKKCSGNLNDRNISLSLGM